MGWYANIESKTSINGWTEASAESHVVLAANKIVVFHLLNGESDASPASANYTKDWFGANGAGLMSDFYGDTENGTESIWTKIDGWQHSQPIVNALSKSRRE